MQRDPFVFGSVYYIAGGGVSFLQKGMGTLDFSSFCNSAGNSPERFSHSWSLPICAIESIPPIFHSPIHKQGGPLFFVLSLIPFGFLLYLLRRK